MAVIYCSLYRRVKVGVKVKRVVVEVVVDEFGRDPEGFFEFREFSVEEEKLRVG